MTSTQEATLESADEKTQASTLPAESRASKPRVSSLYPLPSERIPWSKHFPLIVNAAVRSNFGRQPVDSDAIEEGVGKQTGALSVSFFVDLKLLTKTNRQYLPTDPAIRFAKMINLDEGRAKDILRPVVEETWFAETIRNYLAVRGAATGDVLARELAIAAEVSNFDAKKQAFQVLLQYLSWTGLIALDGENFTNGESTITRSEPRSDAPARVASGTRVVAAPAASVEEVQPRPANNPLPGWISFAWPDAFELRVKPEAVALEALEVTLRNLRSMLGKQPHVEAEPADG